MIFDGIKDDLSILSMPIAYLHAIEEFSHHPIDKNLMPFCGAVRGDGAAQVFQPAKERSVVDDCVRNESVSLDRIAIPKYETWKESLRNPAAVSLKVSLSFSCQVGRTLKSDGHLPMYVGTYSRYLCVRFFSQG